MPQGLGAGDWLCHPLVDPPLLVRGPQGPWQGLREALAARGTAVVYGRLDEWLDAETDESAVQRLLGRDWARYLAMSHPQMRKRFVASRLLLKHAAAAAMDTQPVLIDLAYQQGGRPYLRGCDQIDISLSHTEELIAVGITRRGLIGVDVESADRPMIGTGVELQACTPHERAALEEIPEQARNGALLRLWTLKEAYSKAIGQGMRFRFTEFGFSLGSSRVQLLRPDGSPGTGQEWTFGTCLVDDRYALGVALFDAGFGDTTDTAARSMLDEGLLDTLLGPVPFEQGLSRPTEPEPGGG